MSRAKRLLDSIMEARAYTPTDSHTVLSTSKPLDNYFVKKWDKNDETTYFLIQQDKQIVILARANTAASHGVAVGSKITLMDDVSDPDNTENISGQWLVLDVADSTKHILNFKKGAYPLYLML